MMGESKRYYYIKQKSKPLNQGVDFKYEKPQVVLQPFFSTHHSLPKSGESILDMNFVAPVSSKIWIYFLRWGLLIILALAIYLAGSFLNLSANYTKEDLIRKSEAAASNLQKGALALAEFDLDNARVNFKLADKNFASTLDSFAALGQYNILLAGLPIDRSQVVQAQSMIMAGHHLAMAGVNTIEALDPVLQHWFYPKTSEKIEDLGSQIGQLLIQNVDKIDKALAEVAFAQKYLDSVTPNYVPSEYADLIVETKAKTYQFKHALETIAIVAKDLPQAIGFNNPRYYMLLNQNPNEARATGGFIGSYVIAELHKGKLVDIFTDTTQRIDGQNLYNDMILPKPLESVTAYYGIRDANWDPNFPASAKTIQKLYEQAGGGTVDGIIALNPDIVSDILSVMGPIYMPGYDMTLTADNFPAKVQKHIEVDARGTYNPKQLLMDVIPIIMTRLLNADAYQMEVIGHKLLYRLISKDILLQFSNPRLESVVANLGWGGTISESPPLTDYLYIVESNLGGNKSSGSLVREIDHTALVNSKGIIVDNLKINYTHQGTNEFPDGINKNYIRIYLPMAVRINKLTGYDDNTEVDMDTIDSKTVAGFWLTTSPGESNQIELEYVLPYKLDFIEGQTEYKLIIQKQPGIKKTKCVSQIKVGDGLSLSENNKQEHKTLFTDQLVKDELPATLIYK